MRLREEMYRIQLQRQYSPSLNLERPSTSNHASTNPLANTISRLLAKPAHPTSMSMSTVPATPIRAAANRVHQDWAAVDTELRAYEEEESSEYDQLLEKGSESLLAYWHARREKFPLLYQLAMDTFPAQGSAVSSERVFSSAKRTITDSRNRLLSHAIESRQILKFMFKSNKISMRSRWGVLPAEVAAATIAKELEAALKSRDMEAVENLMDEVDFF